MIKWYDWTKWLLELVDAFPKNQRSILGPHHEFWTGTCSHAGYHYFTIHELRERLVAAAPFGDRVVHHAIVRVIEPIFERRFIEDP